MFPLPRIKALFAQYVLVRLYIEKHEAFMQREFKTTQLPLYAVVEPTGDGKFRKVAVYDEGKINNVDGFADFLRKNLPSGTVASR